MPTRPRVVLFPPLDGEIVREHLGDVDVVTVHTADSTVEAARGADVALADFTGQVRVDAEVAAALAPTCRLVQIPAAGTDSVDLDACRHHGLPVASCAGLNVTAVAEWCVWGAIDAMRRFAMSSRALHEGRWEQLGQTRHELAGTTVGIVGLGRIGTAAAERFAAFDVDLWYWSRRRRSRSEEASLAVTWSELDDLVERVDVLVLACALTDDTRGLLSAERIERMKPTAVVVNAARGEVTDEAALAAALVDGRLHGAAVDAFAVEPLPADHPLRDAPTAVLTPHVAWSSGRTAGRILERSLANLRAALAGEPIEGLVR